jgi:5-methylcytosine-specific restriction endonuclease McrA
MFATYADKYADWVARGKPPSPSLPTHWVWKRQSPLLRRIAAAQDDRCSLCGGHLDFSASGDGQPTFEHVVPLSKGGRNSGNRLAAHRKCNTRKSAAEPTGCELLLLEAVNARLAIAAGSRRAKTPKAVECEASQSGGAAASP